MPEHTITTKDRILRAAKDLFAAEGYATVSVRRIASKADLSPAAIYRHFKNKNALLSVIRDEGFEQLRKNITEAPKNLSAEELVFQICYDYVSFAINNPDYYNLMFVVDMQDAEPPTEDSTPMRSYRTFENVIENYCTQGHICSPDGKIAALGIWSALHGLASLILRNRTRPFGDDIDVDAQIKTILKFILR
ncbi:MAG: TetR/AcrR family transcriptional regulator [Desulfovibrio sp.]